VIEITESTLMAARNRRCRLSAVYGLGVRIAIDDFGSYSSLSYLRPN